MAELTLDDARALLRQNFAPWIHEMRLDFEEIGTGFVRMRMPFSDHLARSGGAVSGQALMAMADTAMVFAAASQLGGYQNIATVSQYLSTYEADAESWGEAERVLNAWQADPDAWAGRKHHQETGRRLGRTMKTIGSG